MPFNLEPNQVHVWHRQLNEILDPSHEASISGALSSDERDRAARITRPASRAGFIEARLFLRRILAGYLGVSPERVALAYEAEGKPRLVGAELFFNLSHSHGQ